MICLGGWPKPTGMPRWLLLSILPFLDGDMESVWNLAEAVGSIEAFLDDDAIAWFLIE